MGIRVLWLTTLLILVAFTLIIIGVLLLVLSALRESERGEKKVEAGGVFIIGPVPIVIGTSERVAKVLMILAIVLLLLSLLVFLVFTGYLRWW
jgi:uncharacterized protein (TIGR00304 family)